MSTSEVVRATSAAPAATGVEAYAAFQATRTFGSLDGLRAISILAVLWHHTDRGAGGSILNARGFLGVDLFFVISGFLIVTLLLRERKRTGDISLKGFYFRRFLRIFPPYYLVLAVISLTAWLKPGHNSEAVLTQLPWSVFYLSNMVHMESGFLSITWSLSTEEQFYMVVPALQKYAGRLFRWVLPALYVLVSLPPFGLFPDLPLPSFFRQTTFGPILLGVMLAHLLDHPRAFARLWPVLGHRLATLGAALLVVLALAQPAADISGWPRVTIHWSMAVLLATCVVRERHALEPILKLWPMRRIGVVSYGIYLYHMLVWYFVDRAMQRLGLSSQPLFFVANTLGSWLVAELSFRYFETRVMSLRNRIGPDRAKVAT